MKNELLKKIKEMTKRSIKLRELSYLDTISYNKSMELRDAHFELEKQIEFYINVYNALMKGDLKYGETTKSISYRH